MYWRRDIQLLSMHYISLCILWVHMLSTLQSFQTYTGTKLRILLVSKDSLYGFIFSQKWCKCSVLGPNPSSINYVLVQFGSLLIVLSMWRLNWKILWNGLWTHCTTLTRVSLLCICLTTPSIHSLTSYLNTFIPILLFLIYTVTHKIVPMFCTFWLFIESIWGTNTHQQSVGVSMEVFTKG